MKHYIGVAMKWTLVLSLYLTIEGLYSDTTVTIYPQWLSQGGNVRYESNRWNKHNGLEKEPLIPRCRSIRTDSGRWINRDINGRVFQDWPEDPNRSGYPDPSYLKNATKQQKLFSGYLANINSGFENDMFMMLTGHVFPTWMNQSQHKGQFPNNVDAAAEFMVLLVQGIYDYTKGRIPAYFEPINEPDSHWKIMNFTTVSILHKLVAEKLHARFNIHVVGPTLTGYSGVMDKHDFSFLEQSDTVHGHHFRLSRCVFVPFVQLTDCFRQISSICWDE
ncbi:uncharacterized protein LOC124268345 [Haliotis rubra]|uniref:uncharacterized protein LOC124268345 n=1 Tax=Haliotis rubra TaxID=36100 RepID=UPI001EE544A9|nr:uncharacterized protein LOC124268345 [Haliotis rubra]